MSLKLPLTSDYKVIVTGGTGTIGAEVVKTLLSRGAFVVVYSRDQNKQFKMNYDFDNPRLKFINGDVCDRQILDRAMCGMDGVIHCAASKHVPLCEQNADSAIKINVEGTRNVLNSALINGVSQFLMLSTDKAVSPTSVMGCTKMLAERITLEYNKIFPCSIVRLGNVFGSNGSVVPTFMDRIKEGKPLHVNGATSCRYFCTTKEIGTFIVDRFEDMEGGEIFIKKMKVMTILQLASAMVPNQDYPIEIHALTQGEKTKEVLITQDESHKAFDAGDYIIISETKKNNCSSEVQFFSDEEIKEMVKECYA